MKAVIYGAGNIGRGFIGQLMSQSGYEVVFLDIAEAVIDRLNQDHHYPVVVVGDDGDQVIDVTNVSGVNSKDEEAAARQIFEADVMATSVGVNVLKFIARPVAKGISARIKAKRPPLNILLCENLIEADRYLKGELFKYLSEEEQKVFGQYVGLVEASIGRMVPVLPKAEGENPLKVCVESFDILHLDKAGFVGEIPPIKNILPYAPFDYFIQRKLFIHNMCHAMTAYLGSLRGYEYIWEAVSDPEIRYCVLEAGTAAARAIAADTKGDLGDLLDFLNKLLFRFDNTALQDTVERVGRDPVRKLKANDRLVGAFLLCKKHGIETVWLDLALAAALSYRNKADDKSMEIQRAVAAEGLKAALIRYAGTEDIPEADLESISVLYGMIAEGSFTAAMRYCAKTLANRIPNK